MRLHGLDDHEQGLKLAHMTSIRDTFPSTKSTWAPLLKDGYQSLHNIMGSNQGLWVLSDAS